MAYRRGAKDGVLSMQLARVRIHNFRSIKDCDVSVDSYSLFVGENNSGKTNLLSALRVFYEDGGLKYAKERDFPKFQTDDKESWIELHFATTADEQEALHEEYRSDDHLLKVRRYYLSEDGRAKAKQSNIYAYEHGELSTNLFYGATNVSSAKLGKLIYIPAVSRVEETMKVSGPSPFRNLINLVMKNAIEGSDSFRFLGDAFERFNENFREEHSSGLSIESIKREINEELASWGVEMDVEVSPISPDDIVKSLLTTHLQDAKLEGQRVDVDAFGQGLQRHLIYTLIRLSSQYHTRPPASKKTFNPDYTLVLFEEPEAFLHPSQQEILHRSLLEWANEPQQQVLISTHSSQFVGKSVDRIPSLTRLSRPADVTNVYQLSRDRLDAVLADNLIPARAHGLDQNSDFDEEERAADEAIKYFLWLDAERSSLFFARHVLLCEGASEKVFFDYIADDDWKFLRDGRVYVLDCLGKFNIHRFVGLLSALGLPHSIIFDGDNNRRNAQVDHGLWNQLIHECRTDLTTGIFQFEDDLEGFLGIEKPQRSRGDLKPVNVIKKYRDGEIGEGRLDELKTIVRQVLRGEV